MFVGAGVVLGRDVGPDGDVRVVPALGLGVLLEDSGLEGVAAVAVLGVVDVEVDGGGESRQHVAQAAHTVYPDGKPKPRIFLKSTKKFEKKLYFSSLS